MDDSPFILLVGVPIIIVLLANIAFNLSKIANNDDLEE